MEAAFAAERQELQSQIDELKSRGWFGSRGGSNSKSGRSSSGGVGGGGKSDSRGKGATATKKGEKVII